MKFDNFEIHASPYIIRASCRDCRHDLIEVPNGWFSVAMFCPKCENVYELKLVKVPKGKVSDEFMCHAKGVALRKKKGCNPRETSENQQTASGE